jgi:hypothetical protein
LYEYNKKIYIIPEQDMKTQKMDGMLVLNPYFDIWHNWDCRVVSFRRWPHFTPKDITWNLFLSKAERTAGLLQNF